MARNLQVASASREKVEIAFRRLGKQLITRSWLSSRNRYRIDTVYWTDKETGHRFGQLVSYIAASVPLHAIDSARFLGRALYCHSINDVHSARHFAYYAELRAAMSILASEGLGVFNNRHYAVTGVAKAVSSTKVSTHQYVWAALKEWASSARAADLISRIVTMNGLRLDRLLQTAFPTATLQPLASNWFNLWGIDLSILSEEAKRRNESSYRPSGLLNTTPQSPEAALTGLFEFWKAFEPTTPGHFGVLDRELVRLAFEQQAKGLGYRKASAEYVNLAQTIAANAALSPTEAILFAKFFLRSEPVISDTLFLVAEAKTVPQTGQTSHFPMIARASILLRVALGSTVLLVSDSGMAPTAFRNWIEKFAVEAALVKAQFLRDDRLGLWDSVDEALLAIAPYREDIGTPADVVTSLSSEITLLAQCERIAVWALASS